jgi:hypothetical protein
MRTRHKNQVLLSKDNRVSKAPPSHRRPVIHTNATTGHVVVIETVHTAQDIIRVSIETARSAGLPERVIVF